MVLVCTCAVVAVVVWRVRSLSSFVICLIVRPFVGSFVCLRIYVSCCSDGIGFVGGTQRFKSKR